MHHIVESQQFTRQLISKLFLLADKLEKKPDNSMKGKMMASLFYEPSTRTRFSFESAMIRLSGNVITTENAKEFSSAAKGETLEDSIRVMSNYCDVIVLRHYEEGASVKAASIARVPIINAGDGAGQHPTQALLDLYTIKRETGRIDSTKIAIVGDLKHGRTVRSLAYLLGKYKNIEIFFVSPKALRIGNDIKVVKLVDVLYQTRIQKERFKRTSDYKKFKGCYRIDSRIESMMRPKSIIMHPLPRVDELLSEVDQSPKAVYFKQAKYGLLVRMALLKYVLG
jgi:aspartate carbamoyltransferase catalytic subunit